MAETSPSFKNPPVIETALGVMFSELNTWELRHFGLYWQKIKSELPKSEAQPPFHAMIEPAQSPPLDQHPSQPQIEFSEMPFPRCWYVSEDDSNLVQVQRDGFFYNWRKGKSATEYPRYKEHVRPGFIRQWKAFNEFLKEEGIGVPSVVQCEVSYINHIPKGEGWESAADWPSVFSVLAQPVQKFLPSIESGQLGFSYAMPDKSGRLRINMNHAVRSDDGKEVLVLRLTTRGRPKSSDTADILDWIDLGREWIVRGFSDFTTERMHKLWGRED